MNFRATIKREKAGAGQPGVASQAGGGASGGAAAAAPAADPGGAEILILRPLTVLIASGDEGFAEDVSAALLGRNCRPLTASDESEAARIASAVAIDILLLERPSSVPPREWESRVAALLAAVESHGREPGINGAPPGVVVVADRGLPAGAPVATPASPDLYELDKTAPFERLFLAILRADRHRRLPRRARHA
ncbi:MAG TPA: hypothetical protein VH061_06370 [Solirubrobacteraceae bacterium]|jgi:hypothetical protein|nr:hypothetical protein [Solirubrobacteraceae bacterium]